MVTKIVSIRNIGKFVSCNAAKDVAFRKITLVFGENGRGKTTMGDILRSLSTGIPDYILGRTTLGAQFPPSAQILLDGTRFVNFKDGIWDGSGPRMAIYDSTFVDENVHSGNSIDREHRKNLYEVIVGEAGVALARGVNELDARIREANKDVTAKENVVKAYLPQGMLLKTFLALSPVAGIDDAIAAKQGEVTVLGRSQEIKDKPALAAVKLPQLPPEFQTLMAKMLEDVSKEAEILVKQHLKTHAKPGGEQWIARGLELASGVNCPFCGQDTEGVDLITAYKAYFSTTYAAFKYDLSALRALVTSLFGDNIVPSVQLAIDRNRSLAEFWREFVAIDLPAFPLDDLKAALSDLKNAALLRVNAKLAAPLEGSRDDPEFDSAAAAYEAVVSIVTNYEAAVAAANEHIATKKRELDTGDLTKAKTELVGLHSVKKRFETAPDEACRSFSQAEKNRDKLKREKETAREQLDEYSENVFGKYEKRINQLLGIFGAEFRIGETKTSLAGGTVSTSYQIIINQVAVELGAPDTPTAKACFKNTLSAGDRSTLALAFFIAKLENDPKLASTVVLFDDPFTSHDQSRRLRTQIQIRKLADSCRQIIVFSHDAVFLKQIADRAPSGDVKVLQFFTTGQGHSKIEECFIDDLTRPEYFRDYDTLQRFLHHADGDPYLVAPAIRRLLESYLRMKQPSAFKPTEWLGDMIKAIRQAAAGSPLHDAQHLLEDLIAINEYSQHFHHGEGTQATAPTINNDELRTYIRQTLDFVGGF
jgi:wobble nucleotide-excising tRNase